MTTDTAALISPDVDWRKQERAMEAAFPQLSDVMLVVVDGATPELAEDARGQADRAAGRRPRRISGWSGAPMAAIISRARGCCSDRAEDVRQATAALIEAQPMLGPLARRSRRCAA